MSAITEQLAIGKELRELKLGKSFRKSATNGHQFDSNADAFHTIRYDFKPASVDTKKMATIEFGENNKATVTVPNVEGCGVAHTMFKGSRKPHHKECVLIIDNETGEITLERLTQNIVVKRTRTEGTSKAQLLQRPVTPSIETNGKKSSPPLPSLPQQSTTTQKSLSPKRNDTSTHSKSKKNSPFGVTTTTTFTANQSIGSNASTFIPPTNVRQTNKDDEMVGFLSETSSDSSDNESLSGGHSSGNENRANTRMPNGSTSLANAAFTTATTATTTNANLNSSELIGEMSQSDDSSSDSDSGSNSDSSDNEDDDETNRDKPTHNSLLPSMPNVTLNSNLPNGSSLPSMPKFSQLSQDLQLSESGSDSD